MLELKNGCIIVVGEMIININSQKDLRNSLHQGNWSNNKQIVLEDEVVDISATQGAEDNMDTQDLRNYVILP